MRMLFAIYNSQITPDQSLQYDRTPPHAPVPDAIKATETVEWRWDKLFDTTAENTIICHIIGDRAPQISSTVMHKFGYLSEYWHNIRLNLAVIINCHIFCIVCGIINEFIEQFFSINYPETPSALDIN
ncbi:hypothetical protein AVEN_93819-1 [Araneus ventricosus]|uniref:Uncharacterized protein n=1 Tax=Araneus ventricosus TaxID=182803 RepID=A0A4Y2AYC8_ARAVE|nr:hypothetical protein AVEN_93819-1 [Araneus ventricosus]